jgi:hypothetical protein
MYLIDEGEQDFGFQNAHSRCESGVG